MGIILKLRLLQGCRNAAMDELVRCELETEIGSWQSTTNLDFLRNYFTLLFGAKSKELWSIVL
jgi:hypothetical protein